MTITVAKKETVLPWGVEIELAEGRCVYMGAKAVLASDDNIEVVVNDTHSISLPRHAVRKIMMMVSPDEQGTESGEEASD